MRGIVLGKPISVDSGIIHKNAATVCPCRIFHALLLMLLCTASVSGALANDADLRDVTVVVDNLDITTFRDAGIDASTHAGAITLSPIDHIIRGEGYRIEHAASSPERRGKYTFELDHAAPREAEVFVFRGGDKARLNGRPVRFEPLGWGAWQVAKVRSRQLRKGINDLRFADGVSLAMDPDESPATHSFVSDDRGRTWKPAKGEFYVHIRLHQHPKRGEVRSQVIDLAQPDDADVVRPAMAIRAIELIPDADTPKGTSIELDYRLIGPMQQGQVGGWTDKKTVPLAADRSTSSSASMIQWRAVLKTNDPTKTPVLRSVTIKAKVVATHNAASLVRVGRADQPEIQRSSYAFTWQGPSNRLTQLREQYGLSNVVSKGKTELDKFILLRNWVRKQWPENDAGSGIRTWDALEILGAPAGKKGMCVHYGVLFTQAALALGYNARQVILNGHYVSEVWSNDYGKWILMDVSATTDEARGRYGSAYYVDAKTGKPLDALALHQAVWYGRTSSVIQKLAMTNTRGVHETYDRRYDEKGLGSFIRFAYPLRNNYLDQLVPWEVAHGQDHYRCNAYLWWKNDPLGHTPEYSKQTYRAADIRWTVNQVRLRAYQTAEPQGVVIHLENDQPNFSHYVISTDNKTWQRHPAANVPVALTHTIQITGIRPGESRVLRVKPINAFGKSGRISTLVLAQTDTANE